MQILDPVPDLKSKSVKILAVPRDRQYPVKDILYTMTSSHLRSPSKKYEYPKQRSPRATRVRKLCLFKAVSDDIPSSLERTKDATTRILTRKGAKPSSLKMGFSDMVAFYINSKATASTIWQNDSDIPKIHRDGVVFEHILKSAGKHLRRTSNARLSLPNFDLKTLKTLPKSIHTRSSTHRTPNEQAKQEYQHHQHSTRDRDVMLMTSRTPISKLPAEKPIKRVKNLRKSPFGIHKTYEPNFAARYIVDELTTDWININNSKRCKL
mmetsp:Transcript_13328/g.25052  ORF Transcript_13328/g.25052 Transcript_13328/m.25052 type:complete len:266 (+) Transcript_13328:1490-2287(+)